MPKDSPLFQETNLFGETIDTRPAPKDKLSERFVVPPFSVLNAREGEWQTRKRAWVEAGVRGEEGRDAPAYQIHGWADDKAGGSRGAGEGTSVFDPVLCELVYRWFAPVRGHVLDPFAGEATKGLVATALGRAYTGIELRAGQVEANQRQAERMGVAPTWVVGDAAKVLRGGLSVGMGYDLLFTSPPYFDLEEYGGGAGDGSAATSYRRFMAWYADIFTAAVDLIRPNRFVVVKVGEVRDRRTGEYYNFVGDNVSLFRSLGCAYWNEMILVTPCGTLPLRVTSQFNGSRKIGKTHQNLLVFYKGDPERITDTFGAVTV